MISFPPILDCQTKEITLVETSSIAKAVKREREISIDAWIEMQKKEEAHRVTAIFSSAI
jgi:hypothetical protein